MYVCIHEIIRLIIMKMKMKMKNRSYRYDINRLRSRHGHKYSRYTRCLSMMMLLCIKQHLSNIGSSIHEKVKQHWGWVDKSVASKKKCVQDHIILKIFTLEGVYTWNFIPRWNSSRDEVIPVYSEMSLTVYTFLPRWNFIPGWTHPCQNIMRVWIQWNTKSEKKKDEDN